MGEKIERNWEDNGEGNHNQIILHEKALFSIIEKKIIFYSAIDIRQLKSDTSQFHIC